MPPSLSDGNWFLSELSSSEAAVLRPHLTSFDLKAGDCLHCYGDPIDKVIFPHSGLMVLTMPLHETAGAGLALMGREGVVGGFAAGASAPATTDCEVLIAGRASRMSASAFRHALEQNPGIRRLAARFDFAMLTSIQQTALCNAVHKVEGRICRWLLEMLDRNDSNRIPLTQQSLAVLLGVRRTTVTLVAGGLETDGALHCRRGHLQIVARDELERRSCECYTNARHFMERLFARREDGRAFRAAVAERLDKKAV
jgi:CRP-like cAMP-binding protein